MSSKKREANKASTGKSTSLPLPTNPGTTLAVAPAATHYAASVTISEQFVANQLPPDPNYPRYRVAPGAPIRLAQLNPKIDTCVDHMEYSAAFATHALAHQTIRLRTAAKSVRCGRHCPRHRC
jgi:hypothetical protein